MCVDPAPNRVWRTACHLSAMWWTSWVGGCQTTVMYSLVHCGLSLSNWPPSVDSACKSRKKDQLPPGGKVGSGCCPPDDRISTAYCAICAHALDYSYQVVLVPASANVNHGVVLCGGETRRTATVEPWSPVHLKKLSPPHGQLFPSVYSPAWLHWTLGRFT